MCNTSFHTGEISGVMGYDLLCAKKNFAENSLKIQLPRRTNTSDRSITKSAACEPSKDFALCLEDSKSPILDVTESVSIASCSETVVNMELSPNENVSAFKFARLNSVNPLTHLSNCNPLPLTFPNLGVLPIGGRTLLSTKPPLPAFEYIAPPNHDMPKLDFPLMELNRVGMFPGFMQRRPRGEKRPIPEEQKDEKYYERRKRNNEAAKKSRDARKIREDRIAFRAALLEQENSILRAQVLALRDELQTVRQLLAINGLA